MESLKMTYVESIAMFGELLNQLMLQNCNLMLRENETLDALGRLGAVR